MIQTTNGRIHSTTGQDAFIPLLTSVARKLGAPALTLGAMIFKTPPGKKCFFPREELGKAVNLSAATVKRHQSRLVRAGYLKSLGRKRRRTNAYVFTKQCRDAADHFIPAPFELVEMFSNWSDLIVACTIIHDYKLTGATPSTRSLAKRLGLSRQSVHDAKILIGSKLDTCPKMTPYPVQKRPVTLSKNDQWPCPKMTPLRVRIYEQESSSQKEEDDEIKKSDPPEGTSDGDEWYCATKTCGQLLRQLTDRDIATYHPPDKRAADTLIKLTRLSCDGVFPESELARAIAQAGRDWASVFQTIKRRVPDLGRLMSELTVPSEKITAMFGFCAFWRGLSVEDRKRGINEQGNLVA